MGNFLRLLSVRVFMDDSHFLTDGRARAFVVAGKYQLAPPPTERLGAGFSAGACGFGRRTTVAEMPLRMNNGRTEQKAYYVTAKQRPRL